MQHNWYLNGELYKTLKTAAGTKSSSCTFTGLSAGTSYTAKVVVYAFNPWRELDSGSARVTTSSSGGSTTDPGPVGPSGPKRPNDWYWYSTVSQGSAMGMSATEWNKFIERIQEFAEYKGVTLSTATISSAIATRGTGMKAYQANAVRSLISRLGPRTSLPDSVNPGDDITARFINGLKNSLNSIS